jgi:hypothetical protein
MALRTSTLIRLALGATFLVAMPSACLYPDYTFNDPEPTGATGGGGSTSSSTTSTGGGAMVSSSSSSGTGGVGGGTGGGGGTPTGEDCLNGADDDGDAAVDCADTDCKAGYACVTSIPFGWSGYAALFEGLAAQEPACPNLFPSAQPYKGNHTPVQPPHTCSSCSCGPPQGQTCDLPDVITLQNKPCGQTATATGSLNVPGNWTGNCYGPEGYEGGKTAECNNLPCNTSATSAAPTVTGGSCAGQGGTPTKPPVAWAILGKACGEAPFGGGCGSGNVCQPIAQPPFLNGLCIYKGGENSCPPGEFSESHIFYQDVTDTRDCSSCQCGAPAGSTCKASLSLFSEQFANSCMNKVATFDAGSCTNLSGNPGVFGRSAVITEPPSGGSCGVTGGGQPTGSLTPANATTFCCIP